MPQWVLTLICTGVAALTSAITTAWLAGRYVGRLDSRIERMESNYGEFRTEITKDLASKVHVNDLSNLRGVVELIRADVQREMEHLRAEQSRQSASYHVKIDEVNANIIRLAMGRGAGA